MNLRSVFASFVIHLFPKAYFSAQISLFFTLGFKPLSANKKKCTLSGAFGADDVCFFYGKHLPRFLRCVALGFLSSALLAKNAPPEHFLYARLRAPIRKPKKCTLPGAFGADDGARTRYLHLGKVALYQMSYIRIFIFI